MNFPQTKVLAPALLLALSVGSVPGFLAASPPKVPADLTIEVVSGPVAAGEEALVELRIKPRTGIKINRYPKVKLQVEGRDAINEAAEVAVGADAPPPADRLDDNYYGADGVPPIQVAVPIDIGANGGRHELDARVTYFYCVTASGFCAPSRTSVTIPVEVTEP